MQRLRAWMPEDFMTWQVKKMQILGIWHLNGRFGTIHYIFFMFTYVFNVSLFVVAEMYQNYVERDNFKQSLLNVSILSLHILCWDSITRCHIANRNGKLEEILKIVQRKSFNFDDFNKIPVGCENIFELANCLRFESYEEIGRFWKTCKRTKNLTFHDEIEDDQLECRKRDVMERARFGTWCYEQFICFGAIIVMLISYITVYIIEPSCTFNEHLNRTVMLRELPFHSYYPFDLSISRNYGIAWVHQFYAIFLIVMQFLGVDVFILSVIIQITYQLRCISLAVSSIDKIKRELPSEMELRFVEIRLVKCINETQQVIRLVDMIEDSFSQSYILSYGFSIGILCTAVTAIPLVKGEVQIEISFCIVAFLTVFRNFVVSWCCQVMKDEFSDLSMAFYNISWFNYGPKFTKNVVFIMARLQKPVYVSMGKFAVLDTQLFLKILKLTYSFYTLLQR